MANKIKVSFILELRAAHMSRKFHCSTRHMSKNSVGDVFHIADSLCVTFEDVKDKDEEEVYRMFYPDKHAVENMYKDADYEQIHKEMKKVGVTLKKLHKEYCDRCKTEADIPMVYTKFCDGLHRFYDWQQADKSLLHKPALLQKVDWFWPNI